MCNYLWFLHVLSATSPRQHLWPYYSPNCDTTALVFASKMFILLTVLDTLINKIRIIRMQSAADATYHRDKALPRRYKRPVFWNVLVQYILQRHYYLHITL